MMAEGCELCRLDQVLFEAEDAYVRYDNNALSRGHVLVVPRRHVADFFEMTAAEKASVIKLLDKAKAFIAAEHKPDGHRGECRPCRRPVAHARSRAPHPALYR